MGVTIIRKAKPPPAPAKKPETSAANCIPNAAHWPFSNTSPAHIWSDSAKNGGKCIRCGTLRTEADVYPKMKVPDALKKAR